MRVLITGGAGFVGSSLARLFKEADPRTEVVCFDNLKRRGSELNVAEFGRLGIKFVHGDIRNKSDFEGLESTPRFDLFVEASAEPSVHAGTGGSSPNYLLETNLVGTLNCLEYGRAHTAGMIFLSTSRVYPIPALQRLKLVLNDSKGDGKGAKRMDLDARQDVPGVSEHGINEDFPVVGHGFRSLYGSTKLASELFVEEYSANFGYPALVNRCGVLAGPGQFGKTDQGVYTLWVARHLFGGPLSYTGFGGHGHQVRDLLHPRDLFALMQKQLDVLGSTPTSCYTVGGGIEGSVSLAEYTAICEAVTGNKLAIGSKTETAAVDIPYFVADASRAKRDFKWEPQVRPKDLALEIKTWLDGNRATLEPLFKA
jgi:CDP-paratose 2-epimerase